MVMEFDRALVIRRKWAEMILNGNKQWEMRSRHTYFRGRFGVIIAGTGLIYGSVTLTASIGPLGIDEWKENSDKHRVPYLGHEQTALKHNHAWVLEGPTKYASPIPYHHPRGAVIWVRLWKAEDDYE